MKVTTTRSKSSETFYICHSFVDKNGKNTSRVHKRLGTLAELSLLLSTDRDGVMAWAKEQAR
ncbi:transposase, partial [[Clostridium] innocuum]|nr:transposase [[Clostridium] innocuum]MCR0571189.1 transposase [[Clostridium] innocuum]MCR0579310.1 transposase [[Clostridium] innocuum]